MFKADAGLGAGYLIFETANGDGDDRVPAGDFAQVMKRAGLPLVVLNACQSAALGGDGATTGATVATRLLEEGVRSVVAMSHSVYAVAAAEFMSAFYDALFQGQSVQEATTAGRLQMRRAPSRPSPKGDLPLQDWIVPVHYERSQLRFPSLAAQPKAGPDLSALLEEIRGGGGTPAGDPAHADDFAPAADLFVGRGSEFYTLEAAARTDRIVLIQGPGGTGKTELAKGFARWWRDTGGVGQPGWVFFHSFEPGLASFGLDSVLGEIARSIFGTEVLAQAAPEELRAAVVQALRAYPMLLVWDNFESVYSMVEEDSATPALDQEGREQIRAFLQEMGGAGGQSTVLITSRTAEDWLGALRRIELGNLPRKDAAEYASKVLTGYATGRTRSAENPKAYEGLMEWLDGHPLSMKLILPHLETRSAKDLLSGLTGQGPLPPEFRLEGRTNSLGASVQYSLTHIDAATCGLLPALSLFEGVADADVLMLMSAVEGCPAPFAGTERDGWAAALERAASLGLLTALGAGTYRLHPALPAYLAAEWRASAGPDFQAQQTATLLALVAAHAWFGQWLNSQIQGGNAQLAFGLIGLQSRTMGRMITAALAQDQHKPAQGILQPLNEYLKARGLIQEQRGWITRCLIATEAADGTAPAFDTEAGALWLFVMSTSASIALDAHNLAEADEVYNRIRLTLEGAEEADERDRRLAIVYHQLGMVAQRRGDLDQAEDWYKKSLEIEEALGNRPGMANSYGQLGILAQRRGDLDQAEDWYKKSLEIEEALGNRPGMANSYGQLGILAQRRGDLDQAEDWYKKSLKISEALGNRTGLAKTYHQLGIVAELRGDLDQAEAWYKKSLEIKEALGNRPGMATTYGQLGLLAEQREDVAGAFAWTIRCILLFDAFGHPATGPAPRHLARLTKTHGEPMLRDAWQNVAGAELPDGLLGALKRIMENQNDT